MESGNLPPILIVFRNDDLSAQLDAGHERRIAAMFQAYHCVQTVGVIPFCTKGDFCSRASADHLALDANREMVRLLVEGQEEGRWEIALHGWSHQINSLSVPARREYMEFRGLPLSQQQQMLAQGAEHIQHVLGTRPVTFIPPWNRLDESTVEACKTVGLKIISAGPYCPPSDGIVALGMSCGLDSFPSRLQQALGSPFPAVLVITYHSRLLRSGADTERLERALKLGSTTQRCQVVTMAQAARDAVNLTALRNAAGRVICPHTCCPESTAARTHFLLRALGRMRLCRSLTMLADRAREAYYAGDYAGATQLADELDRKGVRLLGVLRAVGFAAGLLFTAGMSLLACDGSVQFALILQGCFLMVATGLGGFGWHQATASGTRAEVALLTASTASGILLGGVLYTVVALVR
jgi:peptidoglycan/xylan/chitin deacetylase (PgdA/CDA1 family)